MKAAKNDVYKVRGLHETMIPFLLANLNSNFPIKNKIFRSI